MAREPTANATHARYVVLAWLCVLAALAYVSRNCIGVAEKYIRHDLGLSLDQMGWVFSGFFWSYALAQVPSGLLGHRWGTRRTLPLLATAWSLATAISGLATGLASLLLARLSFGAAQAGVFPCSADTIARWLPGSRRAVATGLLGSSMSLGEAAGVALSGMLLQGFVLQRWVVPEVSWRWLFIGFALPGIAWAAIFYWWFRDRPDDHSEVNEAERKLIGVGRQSSPDDSTPPPTPWSSILTNFDMWMICGQQFFRAAGYVFYATWFPTYLQETRGVSTAESGLLTALPLIGKVVGAVLGGLFVDYVWNRTGSRRLSRQAVALAAMLGCAGFILAAYFVQDPVQAVLLVSAGSLIAAFGGPCAYTVTIDKADRFVAPVFGTMNMAGNFGAAMCPIVVARFVNLTGSWHLVLLLFVGMYVAAAMCWLLLNPNGTLTGTRSVATAEPH